MKAIRDSPTGAQIDSGEICKRAPFRSALAATPAERLIVFHGETKCEPPVFHLSVFPPTISSGRRGAEEGCTIKDPVIARKRFHFSCRIGSNCVSFRQPIRHDYAHIATPSPRFKATPLNLVNWTTSAGFAAELVLAL